MIARLSARPQKHDLMWQEMAHRALLHAGRIAPWIPVWACLEHYVLSFKLVDGRSMQPTFNSRGRQFNDLAVLDKWSARQLKVSRGEVVVLRSPNNPKEWLTKRVIGLPGDCVRPRDASASQVHVPRGHIWVEGDNEHASRDSNHFGAVPAALIEARICYKAWPLSESGRVGAREADRDRLVYRAHCETIAGAAARSMGTLPWHLLPSRRS